VYEASSGEAAPAAMTQGPRQRETERNNRRGAAPVQTAAAATHSCAEDDSQPMAPSRLRTSGRAGDRRTTSTAPARATRHPRNQHRRESLRPSPQAPSLRLQSLKHRFKAPLSFSAATSRRKNGNNNVTPGHMAKARHEYSVERRQRLGQRRRSAATPLTSA